VAQLPFDPSKLDSKNRIIYEEMVRARKKQGAPFDGPYSALMNHPQLCQKIEQLGYYLKFEGHLSREVYQFVVLAVAQSTKASFEWEDHVNHAISAGVPANIIKVLQDEGISSSNFSAPYEYAALVLKTTLIYKDIPNTVQANAIEAYGMLGFIEIVVLSGFYQMFSAINEGFEISLRPGMQSIFK